MWAGRYARRASRIIAETEELRRSLALGWRIPESRIEVVGLGVDRSLFRPLDQAAARRRLHIDPDARVLLYAGVLDQTHNLIPLLEALQATGVPGATLHIAGDGKLRGAYEERARVATIPVLFHGRVPHERMPELIAAADLCLAPYERAVFPEGHVAYSTLKIPEYLACGKPVASVPSGNIARLVRSGATGFLLENEAREWAKLLRSLPTRDRLREMGKAAAADVPAPDWGETAARYLSICEREVSSAERGRAGRERA
jgi:glycosyltransferase involved in cell wall biosynthesis